MDRDALKKQIENMKYQASMERWPVSLTPPSPPRPQVLTNPPFSLAFPPTVIKKHRRVSKKNVLFDAQVNH